MTFFQGAAPAVGTPQTKADTGEPVTDPDSTRRC
jgi:hypothetical protein